MKDELKPCPFMETGEELEHGLDINPIDDWFRVECMCGASGPALNDMKGAAIAWNTRQPNEWVSELRNRISNLELLGAGISKSQLEEFGELVTEIKENILDLLPEPPKED